MLIALANALGLVKMDVSTVIIGGILALVLITAGLLSSTLHLANPKNAWRAVMRFKTSWLSREGVFAILFYPVALLYLLGVYITQNQGNALVTFLGLAVVVLALATVFSTGMIYGCLKTIRQWNTALTPANYILLGLASGSVLLSFLLAAAGASAAPMAGVAAGLLLIAAITKAIYYFWVKQVTGPTINTATGFTRAKVRLFDTGNTAGTFLTDEFGYQADATFLRNLKGAVFGLAFIVPLFLMLLMANGHLGWMGAFLAVLSVLAGLGVERWLFFAEARHVVRLYHGAQHT